MSIISTVTRPWGLYGALALSAALGAGLVWQTLQRSAAEVRAAHAERSIAQERETNERVARETTQEFQRLASLWNARQLEAYRVKADENLRNARLAADLGRQLDRLHGDIAAFAAGEREAAADTIAACRGRATTLGQLLERALRADARHTAAAEEHATDVRALLAAWPTTGDAK